MPKLSDLEQMDIINSIRHEEGELLNGEEEPYFYSEEMLQNAILKGEQEKLVEEMLRKQKRKYKQSLNEYIDHLKKKDTAQFDKSKNAQYINQVNKIKAMQIYQKKIEEELKNEELSMHYKLRDEQANYMRYVYNS